MIKDDPIYQTLLKYDFDLFRGDKDITKYINDHLSQYFTDIVNCTKQNHPFLTSHFIEMLKKEIDYLNEICTKIPLVLELFNDGHIKDAYNKSAELFEYSKEKLLFSFSWSGNNGNFYRIRSGDFRITDKSNSKKQKAELFHIKKDFRNRIGSYRYSVAGYPCLYLSSDIELCWFECGMPKQFSYCQMHITEDGENSLKLIDFSARPIDFLTSITPIILNKKRQNKPLEEILLVYDLLIKYILTYPFAAACSIQVKNRDSKFIEEYVFPQLLMQWIRESDLFDGVKYKSALHTTLVNGMGATNVAIPVKTFRKDGLDENLTKKIQVSDINYLDINKDFEKYLNVLSEIKAFINKLKLHMIQSPYSGDYILELIDLCECIIKTYNALIEGNYHNSDLIFTYLDQLFDYAHLLYSSKNSKAEECIKKALPNQKDLIDKNVIFSHFEEFNNISKKILSKHSVFDFSFEEFKNFENI